MATPSDDAFGRSGTIKPPRAPRTRRTPGRPRDRWRPTTSPGTWSRRASRSPRRSALASWRAPLGGTRIARTRRIEPEPGGGGGTAGPTVLVRAGRPARRARFDSFPWWHSCSPAFVLTGIRAHRHSCSPARGLAEPQTTAIPHLPGFAGRPRRVAPPLGMTCYPDLGRAPLEAEIRSDPRLDTIRAPER